MKLLRALEARLVRAEAAVAVALVLIMLALAGYNVVYRNVLVPLQKRWAHSGPPVAVVVAAPTPAAADDGPSAEPKTAAEGFAGDWGEGGDGEDGDAPPDEKAPGAAEGFAGDWGEDDGAPAEDDDGKADGGKADEDEDADDGGFGKLARIEAAPAQDSDGAPLGGPPAAGSFAAAMVSLIDRMKMGWIDVVLRQMVILVSFFGGMMATQRGKHINVDALSKLIGPGGQRWLGVATNALATGVCAVFASAGADLVAIGRKHPHELTPWADEWVFQLMFPIGFGLLAFHFGVRVIEAAVGAGQAPVGEDTKAGAA